MAFLLLQSAMSRAGTSAGLSFKGAPGNPALDNSGGWGLKFQYESKQMALPALSDLPSVHTLCLRWWRRW